MLLLQVNSRILVSDNSNKDFKPDMPTENTTKTKLYTKASLLRT